MYYTYKVGLISKIESAYIYLSKDKVLTMTIRRYFIYYISVYISSMYIYSTILGNVPLGTPTVCLFMRQEQQVPEKKAYAEARSEPIGTGLLQLQKRKKQER